jgi:hypothetical protein
MAISHIRRHAARVPSRPARGLATDRRTEDNHAMPVDLRAAVYGTISIGALLAAESVHQETYAATLGAVAITLLIYVFIHA